MKTIRTHTKSLAFIFLTLIFLQSCTIYKSVPVSLDNASQVAVSSKVFYKNSNTQKCRNIIKENSTYYCLIRGKHKKHSPLDLSTGKLMPIDIEQVEYVKVEDRTTTTIIGVTMGLAAAGMVGYLIVVSAMDAFFDSLFDSF